MPNNYYPPPQNKPKFWTAGKSILAIVVVLVIGIAIAGVAMNMPFLKEGTSLLIDFQQEMYKAGDNNTIVPGSNAVMFPSTAILLQQNNSPATIFSSISSNVLEVRQKMTAPANDKVWVPTSSTNTLTKIDPYVTYYVKVSTECSLQLKSLLPQ